VVTDACGYYPGGDQPMSLKLPSGRTGVFITDPQLRGTVRAIADADKNATNVEFKTYDISPWGEVAADTGSVTRLRLAGQQYDQGARLYYLRARYYDPQLGRFLSEDPIGISGGLNLYAYAGNDPVNHYDPSGTAYRWTEQGWCQRMADIQGTYDIETGEVLTWHITGEHEDCKPGTGSAAGGKGGGPGDGSQPADDETMGRGPKPSCQQLAVRFATNAILDVALGGLGEVLRGVEAIGHANALLRVGGENLGTARGFLREGNAPLAAVMEGNGLRLLAEGGALSAERLRGEQLVTRGVAGSVHSFATAQSLLEVAVSFIPYAATALSGYQWAKECVLH
jgi:RHS repeat-associated protein